MADTQLYTKDDMEVFTGVVAASILNALTSGNEEGWPT